MRWHAHLKPGSGGLLSGNGDAPSGAQNRTAPISPSVASPRAITPQVLLNAAALKNIYNYPIPGLQEELAIPPAQQGPAIPIFGEMTTQAWLSKLKAVAEDQTIGGLKMANLAFSVMPMHHMPLAMRDGTAKFVFTVYNVPIPAALADVVMTNQPPKTDQTPMGTSPVGTPQRGSASASWSSPAPYQVRQTEVLEVLAILRGIKRAMLARGLWIEEGTQQNQCAQQ